MLFLWHKMHFLLKVFYCGGHASYKINVHILCRRPQVGSLRIKYTSLFSGPLLPLSHPSPQTAPYLCSAHNVQSVQMSTFMNQNSNNLLPFSLWIFFLVMSNRSFWLESFFVSVICNLYKTNAL